MRTTEPAPDDPVLQWTEEGKGHCAHWRSENGAPPPKRVVVADDRTTADAAYRLASQGTALLWRGDFQNARQLLRAMSRRIDRKRRKATPSAPSEAFHRYRQERSQRARMLGMLLIPFNSDYTIPLRRAPDVRRACLEAFGPAAEPSVGALRELLGVISAHEWREKGVEVPEIGEGVRIHPHYGVFAPIRSEYVELVATTPLPSQRLAFDIGTGTGVLSAALAQRGVERIVATDQDTRALTCARANLDRLVSTNDVDVVHADLFPPGRAQLVVCNPPWIPARPTSPLERAIYDPDGRMLRGFLNGLVEHLQPGGEGWLVLSDFAEHVGLRSRETLFADIQAAGLRVLERRDIHPRHPRAAAEDDPLHAARAAEVTSLWRLGTDSPRCQ